MDKFHEQEEMVRAAVVGGGIVTSAGSGSKESIPKGPCDPGGNVAAAGSSGSDGEEKSEGIPQPRIRAATGRGRIPGGSGGFSVERVEARDTMEMEHNKRNAVVWPVRTTNQRSKEKDVQLAEVGGKMFWESVEVLEKLKIE